jgi:hypothetical protein
MPIALVVLAVLGLGAGFGPPEAQQIEGVVVNGSQGQAPVAGAEVLLRGGEDGALVPLARTTADANGCFRFVDLPVEPGLVYRPGANRQGVHYPGPRLLARVGAGDRVTITVYDTVAAPSPLVADRHDLDIEVKPAVLTVTETLVVRNPTLTTYVGQPGAGPFTATLALSIPDGFERVTFADAFHGRQFHIVEKHVVTDIPWTPGSRELRFTYSLVRNEGRHTFVRLLDLPTAQVRVRVRGEEASRVVCDLPRVDSPRGDSVEFRSTPAGLEPGHRLTVESGAASTPWIVSARWIALLLFGALVLGTLIVLVRPARIRGQGRPTRAERRHGQQKSRQPASRSP